MNSVDLALDRLALSESELTDRIVALPASEVPAVVLHLRALKQAIARLEAVAEARCGADWAEIAPMASAWVAPDGIAYTFSGDFKHEVKDPEGLRAELIRLATEKGDTGATPLIRDAFRVEYRTMQNPLNTLEKFSDEYEAVIRDFRKWKESPKHLRAVDRTAK